jgi:tetraacyldisaccharide 4'-kinase
LKRKAIFLLYRVLQALASPILLVYLLLRGVRTKGYLGSLRERLGLTPPSSPLSPSSQQTVSVSIWFHAVSVGEVLAAVPLIEEVRKRTPATPVFVSTATMAGRSTAEKRLAGLADGVFFAPLDFVWVVRRVLRRLRPTVVVVLETEIWPNLFREAKRLGCGLAIVNGRISDRALERYRRFAPLFSTVLELCDTILTQSDEMSARFEAAGAPRERVHLGGNLKYDAPPTAIAEDSPALAFVRANRARPLWIAASTSADEHVEEEDFVIAAQQVLSGWRLIIAPRKPERFDAVAARLSQSGLRWTRRSALNDPGADVLLLDSIGELSGLFAHGSVVFMGGTLADRGGHNILEPAIFGKPIVVGPHMENFREIACDFERRRAVLRIERGDQLGDAIAAAAADSELGERARAAAEANRGASRRAADAVLALYESNYPCERRAQPAHGLLWMLSCLWRAGSAIDRRRKTKRALRLPVPVISVGNITAGGTGKTPVTIELLRAFRNHNPGMLTRGHGRTVRENVLFLNPEEKISRELTGDEAQLCMRAVGVPIGVGADRYVVGEELLLAFDVKVLFLDDGFQHRQLARDFDLVLVDAMRPFGGGHLLPLGRLREPLEGLARAGAFLITRSEEAPNTRAIENTLRRYNKVAPVYRARTIPARWIDAAGNEHEPEGFRGERTIAFCGIGNPNAFWKTLERLGIHPAACIAYDDHHVYSPSEVRRLVQHARDLRVRMLLTTAKDVVNLPAGYLSILDELQLWQLEIRTEIEGEEDLVRLIRESALRLR